MVSRERIDRARQGNELFDKEFCSFMEGYPGKNIAPENSLDHLIQTFKKLLKEWSRTDNDIILILCYQSCCNFDLSIDKLMKYAILILISCFYGLIIILQIIRTTVSY